MKDRDEDVRTVDEIVAELIRANGWEKQLELYSLFPRWPELVSEDAGEHSRPVRIDRDILWLEVENSAWMTHFQYEKYEMLDAVNAILRIGRIRDIKMALPKKEQSFVPIGKDRGPTVVYSPPSPKEIELFQKKLDGLIEDDACRESLEHFWYLAHACKRSES